MIFALDWDGTFTADPDLFRTFVGLLLARGHTAIIVTARRDDYMRTDPTRHWGDEVREAIGGLIPIVFAGGDVPKAEAAKNAGYIVDIWIDDNPAGIGVLASKQPLFTVDCGGKAGCALHGLIAECVP